VNIAKNSYLRAFLSLQMPSKYVLGLLIVVNSHKRVVMTSFSPLGQTNKVMGEAVSAAKPAAYKEFKLSDKGLSAFKNFTLEGKEYTFTVTFPANCSSKEKEAILDQFNQTKVNKMGREAVELGLGKKFSDIKMTFESEQMPQIEGTKVQGKQETKVLDEAYFKQKIEQAKSKNPEALSGYERALKTLQGMKQAAQGALPHSLPLPPKPPDAKPMAAASLPKTSLAAQPPKLQVKTPESMAAPQSPKSLTPEEAFDQMMKEIGFPGENHAPETTARAAPQQAEQPAAAPAYGNRWEAQLLSKVLTGAALEPQDHITLKQNASDIVKFALDRVTSHEWPGKDLKKVIDLITKEGGLGNIKPELLTFKLLKQYFSPTNIKAMSREQVAKFVSARQLEELATIHYSKEEERFVALEIEGRSKPQYDILSAELDQAIDLKTNLLVRAQALLTPELTKRPLNRAPPERVLQLSPSFEIAVYSGKVSIIGGKKDKDAPLPDFIVNPANKDLRFGGGLSEKINEALEESGQEIKKKFVKEHNKDRPEGSKGLGVGEPLLIPTFIDKPKAKPTALYLRGVKAVIHTPGPDLHQDRHGNYSSEKEHEEELLEKIKQLEAGVEAGTHTVEELENTIDSLGIVESYINSINEAVDATPEGVPAIRIGFPAISAGIFEYDPEKYVRYVFDAMERFAKDYGDTKPRLHVEFYPRENQDTFLNALKVKAATIEAGK
jgi:O-acetyl-ADP-ribose deacetylase (regulator of RNase III)